METSDSPFRFHSSDFCHYSSYDFINSGAWHIYQPLFNSSVSTFLFAFFGRLSPCNLSCYLEVTLYQLEPRARFHISVTGHTRLVGHLTEKAG